MVRGIPRPSFSVSSICTPASPTVVPARMLTFSGMRICVGYSWSMVSLALGSLRVGSPSSVSITILPARVPTTPVKARLASVALMSSSWPVTTTCSPTRFTAAGPDRVTRPSSGVRVTVRVGLRLSRSCNRTPGTATASPARLGISPGNWISSPAGSSLRISDSAVPTSMTDALDGFDRVTLKTSPASAVTSPVTGTVNGTIISPLPNVRVPCGRLPPKSAPSIPTSPPTL